jgi:hypothetical protein
MRFWVDVTYCSRLVPGNTCFFICTYFFMHFIVERCMFNFLNAISSHFF